MPPLVTALSCLYFISFSGAVAQTSASGAPPAILDPKSARYEYSFASPNSSSVSKIPAPEGLDDYAIPGINLRGYSRQLGIDAKSVTVESVDVVELPFPELRFSSLEQMPALPKGFPASVPESASPKPFHPAGIYPAAWAQIRPLGRMGVLPVCQLIVNPYRYDPQRGVLLWARRIVLRVDAASAIDRRTLNDISLGYSEAYQLAHRQTVAMPLSSGTASVTVAPDGIRYKMYVKQDGVYRVTGRELSSLGVPLSGIDSRTLKLYKGGTEMPVYIYDRGDRKLDDDDYIEFFGERRRADSVPPGSDLHNDLYTIFNCYYLVWGGGAGKRVVDEDGDPSRSLPARAADISGRDKSFQARVHFEQDTMQTQLGVLGNVNLGNFSDIQDRYFWDAYSAFFKIKGEYSLPLPHPNTQSDLPIDVSVSMRGTRVRNQIPVVHTIGVSVGDKPFYNYTFLGIGLGLAKSNPLAGAFTNRMLKDTAWQKITIDDKSPQAVEGIEEFFLNWIEVVYQRLYRASSDQLECGIPKDLAGGYYSFALRGFSGPNVRVYRKGVSLLSGVSVVADSAEPDSAKYTARFKAYAASDREVFYALTEKQLLKPVLARDSSQNLTSGQNDFNYLIIVDDSTSNYAKLNDPNNPLTRFAQFKALGGKFKPKIIRAADIYDEFSGGAVSPEAIRSFLAYAYHNWKRQPKYVLLVGNGYPLGDRDTFALERSYIPSVMFQTFALGPSTCDYLYGCVDGEVTFQKFEDGIYTRWNLPDPLAEIFVGRVVVGSNADITTYADKLISQETRADNGEWRNRIGLVAGPAEGDDGDLPMNIFANDVTLRKLRYISEPHRLLSHKGFMNTRYFNEYRYRKV